MATYQRTLNYSLEAYPSLHINEEEVLHFLFFVNGNGNHWINGELVEKSYYAMRKTVKKRRIEHIKEYGTSDISIIQEKEIENRKKHKEINDKINVLLGKPIDENKDNRRKLYPICRYANIVNIPRNIKPDWLKAARKAIIVAETQYVTTDEDKVWIEKAKLLLSSFPS
jgi:hypothetical protein